MREKERERERDARSSNKKVNYSIKLHSKALQMSHSPNGRRTHKTDTVAGHGRTGQDHGPTEQGT